MSKIETSPKAKTASLESHDCCGRTAEPAAEEKRCCCGGGTADPKPAEASAN
jgi:hypothetical protein